MSDLNWGGGADEPGVRRFYSARTAPPDKSGDAQDANDYGDYTPNEEYAEPDSSARGDKGIEPYIRDGDYYEPNEEHEEPVYEDEVKDAPPDEAPAKPDYSAYYRADAPKELSPETPAKPDYSAYYRADAEAEPPPEAPAKPDYSAYYRADAASSQPSAPPAYAPPKRLDLRGTLYLSMTDGQAPSEEPVAPVRAQPQAQPPAQPQMNVYRPREATWAETERRGALGSEDYQVRDEEPARKPKKRHGLRNTLIILAVLALLGAAGYIFREPLGGLLNKLTGSKSTLEPAYAPVTTPAPVRGYDEAPKTELSESADREIDSISGSLQLENAAITAQNVLTYQQRPDGLYDYYLFTSGGRLLCYFEGLQKNGMTPSEDGGFYVRQSPYLIKSDGSALVRLDGLETTMGRRFELRQLMHGWAMLADERRESFNYMNTDGDILSALWFSLAYPFTGDYTAAYVDTGVSGSERYMLYVLSADGAMTKWLEAPDQSDIAASACAAACMRSGELYMLADTGAPLVITDDAIFYPDCDAIVARDKASGKYGLYVGGEKHYDFLYDSIQPVQCEIQWDERKYGTDAGNATIRAVTDAGYPQPLSHYFELQRDGGVEYVALSAVGGTPVLLDEQP